ncbi:MAG: hypothetical protein E7263_10725 [Lachnospiraceae bacterium]|nr:hypothetical protein [Lachnospiraceae bacterium]
MVLKIFVVKIIRIIVLFAIFAVIMIVRNKGNKKNYGKIVLATILPALMEIVKLFDVYFRSSMLIYMIAQIVLWLLVSFVYVWAILMIYKSTTSKTDGIFAIFKNEFKGWNVVVLVTIVLGVCSLIGQGWYMIEHGEEYAQMIIDSFYNSNFLSFASGAMDFNTIYDKLVDFNVALKLVMVACMVIPSVVNSGMVGKTTREETE